MARFVRRRLLALASVSVGATYVGLTPAGPVFAITRLAGARSAELASAVEATIRRQLRAFREGDAEAAFKIAAPFIQQKFRNPQLFMEMVRRGYPVIYQPASVEFLDLTPLPDGSYSQLVQMSDASAKIWMMEYLVSQDDHGNWRINGVQQQKTRSNLI
ncbi:MAG: DUF4864 domain-containing protein [Burkholderiaceae bacterium]